MFHEDGKEFASRQQCILSLDQNLAGFNKKLIFPIARIEVHYEVYLHFLFFAHASVLQ